MLFNFNGYGYHDMYNMTSKQWFQGNRTEGVRENETEGVRSRKQFKYHETALPFDFGQSEGWSSGMKLA